MLRVSIVAASLVSTAAMQLSSLSVRKQDPWGAADPAVVVEDVVVEIPLVQDVQALARDSNMVNMSSMVNLSDFLAVNISNLPVQDIQDIVADVVEDIMSDFPDMAKLSEVVEATDPSDNVTNISADGATLDSVALPVTEEVAVAGTPNTAIVNALLNGPPQAALPATGSIAVETVSPSNTASVATTVSVPIKANCKDIKGHYQNKAGNLVTVTQTGCDVDVLLKLDETRDEEVLTGAVQGMFITAAGIPNMGAVVENDDIKFMDGPQWHKLNEMDLHFLKKDGCSDLAGKYVAQTGKLISIEQFGCRAVIEVADGVKENTVTKPGSIVVMSCRCSHSASLPIATPTAVSPSPTAWVGPSFPSQPLKHILWTAARTSQAAIVTIRAKSLLFRRRTATSLSNSIWMKSRVTTPSEDTYSVTL